MAESTSAMVAVPVELIERVANLLVEGPGTLGSEFRALLPKPVPRLVAVDPVKLEEAWDANDSDAYQEVVTRPDLLTLLDDVADSMYVGDTNKQLKLRIRLALGVAE